MTIGELVTQANDIAKGLKKFTVLTGENRESLKNAIYLPYIYIKLMCLCGLVN